jgi:hypothetical protein
MVNFGYVKVAIKHLIIKMVNQNYKEDFIYEL